MSVIRKQFIHISFICALALSCLAVNAEPVEEFATMRDGVKLAADVYKPEGEGLGR